MSGLSETMRLDASLLEEKLKELLGGGDQPYGRLTDAMNYSLMGGGKRIRPFLCIEFCRMLGGNIDIALHYASAIECIHTYSLIHDDLPCMDNDDYRRGKLTNHKMFDEATAVLAGDGLLTEAFGIAAKAPAGADDTRLEAVALLSEMAGKSGMVGGQIMDMLGENGFESYELFCMMNRLKTGCLLRAACCLGALASGFGKGTAEYKTADEFGASLGLAFQIEDDLLDEGEEGKTTFLSYMSKDDARKQIAMLTDKAKKEIAEYPNNGILLSLSDFLATRTK